MSISAGTIYLDVRPDVSGLSSASTTSKMSAAMGKLAKVAGAAFVAKGAFDLGAAMVSSASDLQESVSKTEVVFGKSASGIQAWAEDAAQAFGQSQQQALEAVGTYGNLFQAFGVGRSESAKMSKSLVELAADLASFNNASPEETLLALRSGLSGETEPLKRFGIALSQARIEEEALRLGLIKQGEELDTAAKSQASYSLIMKDSALAQGDFERTSDGLANQQRILSATWQDLQATLGKALIPLVTKLAQAGTALLGVIGGLFDGSSNLGDRFSFLGDAFDDVKAAGLAVWRFFKEDLLGVWRSMVEVYDRNLKPALSNLWSALKKLAPVAKVVVTVWVAIQAILLKVVLKVLPFLIRLLGGVIQVVSKVIEVAATLYSWLAMKLVGAFETVGRIAGRAWDLVKEAWQGAGSFFSGIWNTVKSSAISVWNAIANAWNSTVGSLSFRAPGWVPIIGGQGWDVPDIPTVALAQGGLVTQPTTALIGEAGPEAVIPLRGRTLDVRVMNPQDFPDGSAAALLVSRAERTRR